MAESRTYRNGRRDSFKKVISVGNGFHARFLLGLGHCLERAHDDKPKCPAIGGPSAHAPAFGYDNVSSVIITSATRFSFTNKSDMIKSHDQDFGSPKDHVKGSRLSGAVLRLGRQVINRRACTDIAARTVAQLISSNNHCTHPGFLRDACVQVSDFQELQSIQRFLQPGPTA